MKREVMIWIAAGVALAAILILIIMLLGRRQTNIAIPLTGAQRPLDEIRETVGKLPDGFALTDDEKAFKADIAAHGVPGQVASSTEGTDYVPNVVLCSASDRERAETIAAIYRGTLTDFSYGVATITLDPEILTVEEAVRLGADPDNDYPPVEPNYILHIQEP